MNRVMNGDVNATIIINGSSRALTHYDPRVLSQATGLSTYNLGMNGVQIDVQLAILKTYLRHNRKPTLIIQNLDSFSFEPTQPGSIYDPGVYLPYIKDQTLSHALVAIDADVWKWQHIPLYGYVVEDMRFTWLAGLSAHFGYLPREDYYLGFNPRFIEWTEDFERFRAAVPNGVRYEIEPRGVNALLELVKICRDADIRLILVYSPEYIEMQHLERNRDAIFRRFEQISASFSAPLWDYSDSPISKNRDNFYNSQHLNARGAAIFSKALGARLKEFLALEPHTNPVPRRQRPFNPSVNNP